MLLRPAILFGLLVATFGSAQAQAQLLPDGTLGKENSIVTPINSLEDVINGGAIRNSNLFHSFKEFNVGKGRSVYFNNPAAIQNILTRVTGSNLSEIQGNLGVLGNANLFLINPNGIIFGKDASLDINGSFVGSTASYFNFADGTQFSTVSPETPLLTISAPLGLGMGNNPGEIRVNGYGNKFSGNGFNIPYRNNDTQGLEVGLGKTLALVGGNLILEGGSLKTKSGRIELGSVGSGEVDFKLTPDLKFSYSNAQTFQDIQLSQKASLDVSSISQIPANVEHNIKTNLIDAGSIQIQGKNISLSDNSFVFLQNQGNLPSGSIDINASDSLEILLSNVKSQALLSGKGGDINISTKNLTMRNSAFISAFNYGSDSGGNIEINASDSIEMIGLSSQPQASSSIATSTFNSGNGGNTTISTSKLNVIDGGIITSSTFNRGNAGELVINARESVQVFGVDANSPLRSASVLTSATFGSGNGGNLTLNTQRLAVKGGGRVDASTAGSGAAGSITINASDKIELAGSSQKFLTTSRITSSADAVDSVLQERFGLPPILTGESGAVTINTNQLNIADEALLAVKNDGSGNAGKLNVKANTINLKNQAAISATTTAGGGGDIYLQTQNLLLQDNSNISATAGIGNGGNILIETQLLTALQNSDITANSEGSFGGKVAINAKGIVGTQFREFSSSQSDITATSGLGAEFNGVVDINTITTTPNSGLIELPSNLADSSQKIVAGCSANQASKFTIVGRGGLPESPNQLFVANTPIVDLVDLVPASENQKTISPNNHKKEIVEAQGWIVDAQGNIEFVAEVPEVTLNSGKLAQAHCQSLS